jgi:hypothetical protein
MRCDINNPDRYKGRSAADAQTLWLLYANCGAPSY